MKVRIPPSGVVLVLCTISCSVGFLPHVPARARSPSTARRALEGDAAARPDAPAPPHELYAAPRAERGVEPLYAAPRAERRSERKTTLEGDSRVVTLEKEDPFSSPQLTLEKSTGMEDMLRELREIQGSANRTYCILGTRHCSYLHQQIIELLSYALVLSGNHVYTSGAAGTNAAAIRGALRANSTELLTVILPQSRSKQTEDCQELISEVTQVVQMPENDALSLDVASKRCNRRLVKETEHLIAFAYHDSKTVVRTTVEAKEMDKLVTVMYLD